MLRKRQYLRLASTITVRAFSSHHAVEPLHMIKSSEAMGKHLLKTRESKSNRWMALAKRRQIKLLYSVAESLDLALQLIQASSEDETALSFAPLQRLLSAGGTASAKDLATIAEHWSHGRLEVPEDGRVLRTVIVDGDVAWSILETLLASNSEHVDEPKLRLIFTAAKVLSFSPQHLQKLKEALMETSLNQKVARVILRRLLNLGHARFVADAAAQQYPEIGLAALLECVEWDLAMERFWKQSNVTHAQVVMEGLAAHVKSQPVVAGHRMEQFAQEIETSFGWKASLPAIAVLVETYANHNLLNQAETRLDRIRTFAAQEALPSLALPFNRMVTGYFRSWVKFEGTNLNPDRFFQMFHDLRIPPTKSSTFWYIRILLRSSHGDENESCTQQAQERLLELERDCPASVGVNSYEAIALEWCRLGSTVQAENMIKRMIDREFPASTNCFARVMAKWMKLVHRREFSDEAERKIDALLETIPEAIQQNYRIIAKSLSAT